jgi:cellulose biosynthesis protein BcsQ
MFSALSEIAVGAGSSRLATSAPATRIVSVVNGKGGVGKTTLVNNLAVYAQTIDASLPVLVVGLDDQAGPDSMFACDAAPQDETAYTALQRGTFESAIQVGRYGVHYVPSSPQIGALARQAVDPCLLQRTLRRTAFPGLVLIDTASDLGALTRSAIVASDLCLVPVADSASLDASQQVFDLLDDLRRPRNRARLVLSMLDLRIRYPGNLCADVLGLLVANARRLDRPLFQSFITRSPRVQALATNPEGRTFSILNEASRTNVHLQMGELAEELLEALESLRSNRSEGHAPDSPTAPREAREGPHVWLRPRTPEAALAVHRDGQGELCIRDFPFFIGRQDPAVLNDLAIPDLRPWYVSRRHAHFIRRAGRIGVMDLGSSLGTWVDGHQLGSPTADPGPVFFGARGGELVLGKRDSPYAFDVEVTQATAAAPPREAIAPVPLRSREIAALAS